LPFFHWFPDGKQHPFGVDAKHDPPFGPEAGQNFLHNAPESIDIDNKVSFRYQIIDAAHLFRIILFVIQINY
jgi:hypothetical protein